MILLKVFNAMDIYTPLGEAKEEIWRRWNDTVLQKKVSEYLGEMPAVFQNEPRAVLDRTVISPNYEFSHFLDFVRHSNLKPLGWEYQEDKFCSKNPDKLGLAKMPFFHKRNKKGEAIYSYGTIIDCTFADGKQFSRIKTLWGERLIDCHHRLLTLHSPEIEIADGSRWYSSNGRCASKYYLYFLALFVCHGVLFENFITNEKEEGGFSRAVVMPAFEQVTNHFAVKPLIVQLLPSDKASDQYWRSYPEWVEKEVERCLSQTTKKP
ncbi:MAG: hypothetical protein WA126_14845 [Thermodesulfovibrionales bacterium]